MIIENPEQFKSWLTRVLEPLCEADPAALSKYVYALVKKDKPQETLREEILDQLDVFLLNETKNFVDILFNALESNDYMKPQENEAVGKVTATTTTTKTTGAATTAVTVSSSESANGELSKQTLDDQIDSSLPPVSIKTDEMTDVRFDRIKPIIPVTSLPNLAESLSLNVSNANSEKENIANRDCVGANDYRKSRTHGYHYQSRQRSRSRDRQRRSRERSTRVTYRSGINRSPTRQRHEKRRGSRSPTPSSIAGNNSTGTMATSSSSSTLNHRQFRTSRSRSRSRSKSPRVQSHRGNRYRNHHSYSRSRSPSFDRKSGCGTKRSRSTTPPGVDSTNNKDTHHSFGNEVKKKRCRDYETRGFCVRGDMCQYDHGMDAVVIRNAAALGFGATGASNGVGVPLGLNDDMFIPSMATLNKSNRFPEYNPSAPSMWQHGGGGGNNGGNPMFRPGLNRPQSLLMQGPPPPPSSAAAAAAAQSNASSLPPPPPPGSAPFNATVQIPLTPHQLQQQPPIPAVLLQRELINVPVLDNNNTVTPALDHSTQITPFNAQNFAMNSYPYPPPPIGLVRDNQQQQQQQQMYKTPFFGVHHNGLQKKKNFDYNRLGPKKQHQTNCSLELKKIPIMQNNISQLNDHFAKFGKIVNIQVSYEGDPESALITFSNHYEANAAYKSTEPILNNRFIKVFWHKSNETQPDILRPEENQTSGGGDDKKAIGNESGVTTNVTDSKTTTGGGAAAAATAASIPSKSLTYQNYSKKKLVLPSTDKLVKINNISSHAKAKMTIGGNSGGTSGANSLSTVDNKTLQLTIDLRKRKQDLLDKQLEQQKLLLERLEKPDLSECNRKMLMKTIITVQKSIEEIRKELMPQGAAAAVAAVAAQTAAVATVAKPSIGVAGQTTTSTATGAAAAAAAATAAAVKKLTKEEAQKEVLDVELELINKQQEGQDTTALQKKLNLLKIQAGILLGRKPLISSSTKLVNNNLVIGAGVGAAHSTANAMNTKKVTRFPNRSALSKNNVTPATLSSHSKISGIKKSKYSFQKNTVDNRPSTIGISGFELDECDTVLKNFKTFGLIDKHSLDESIPCLKLTYKNRKDAEKAMQNSIMINDRLLTVAWQQPQLTMTNVTAVSSAPSAASIKTANRIAVLKKRLDQVLLQKNMMNTTLAKTQNERVRDDGGMVTTAVATKEPTGTATVKQNVHTTTTTVPFKGVSQDDVTNMPMPSKTNETEIKASNSATTNSILNKNISQESQTVNKKTPVTAAALAIEKSNSATAASTTTTTTTNHINIDLIDGDNVDDVPDDCLLENYSEEVLLQDDEEDDDETADRSWKR